MDSKHKARKAAAKAALASGRRPSAKEAAAASASRQAAKDRRLKLFCQANPKAKECKTSSKVTVPVGGEVTPTGPPKKRRKRIMTDAEPTPISYGKTKAPKSKASGTWHDPHKVD